MVTGNPNGKVVIVYAWGTQNPGDHALTLGALHWLSSFVPEEALTVITRYGANETKGNPTEDLHRAFPETKILPGPFAFSRKNLLGKQLQKAHGVLLAVTSMVLPALALKLFRNDPALKELAGARLVLLNGGNLFYWHRVRRSPARLLAFAFPLVMAQRLGIPYGFLPQTSGPFEGRVPRLIGKLFQGASVLLFRDSSSLDHVKRIADLSHTPTQVVPDLAFYIGKSHGDCSEVPASCLRLRDFIAVVLRVEPLGSDVSPDMDDPQATLARLRSLLPQALAEVHRRTRKKIIFVVQVESDREVTLAVQRSLQSDYAVETEIISLTKPSSFCRLYAQAAFLISMRLHSMIFSLSQGTPVLALWRTELGKKIPSMMDDLGLSSFCMELQRTTSSGIVEAAMGLSANLQGVRNQLATVMQERREAAGRFIRPILEAQGLNVRKPR